MLVCSSKGMRTLSLFLKFRAPEHLPSCLHWHAVLQRCGVLAQVFQHPCSLPAHRSPLLTPAGCSLGSAELKASHPQQHSTWGCWAGPCPSTASW